MNKEDFKTRTKSFALSVIILVGSLSKGKITDVIGKQLLRCGTSVGANYRAACRARSTADFIFKMGIVEEEVDESIFWMELLVEAGQIKIDDLRELLDEANQLLAMTVSSIKTARNKSRK